MIYCAYCKGRVLPTDRKCPSCGSTSFVTVEEAPPQSRPPAEPEPLYTPIAEEAPKNRWIALGLCLVGGYAGLHRFYVGKIGTGVLYLLTFGGFFFGTLADFFSILFGHFRDKSGRKLSS